MAMVSDAGTPLISDPGYKLVREVVGLGLNVTALPRECGASGVAAFGASLRCVFVRGVSARTVRAAQSDAGEMAGQADADLL